MKFMTAEEFDKKFDDGEDISEYLDMSSIRKPNLEPKRINIDFPTWMVKTLDNEARHIGVSRQAIIKCKGDSDFSLFMHRLSYNSKNDIH